MRLWFAAPCGLDHGHIDFLHVHHGVEGAFGFRAACRHGFGQDARGDLPVDAPPVLAPAAGAFLAAIADDGVPVAVGLFLEEQSSLCGNAGPPVGPMQATPATVNSTVSTSPALPEG